MKFDFEKTFTTRDGKPITVSDGKEAKVLRAKDASLMALDQIAERSKHGSPEDKYRRYQLANKIEAGSEDFTVEEASFLKSVIGEFGFTPTLHGQMIDFLDQKVILREVKSNA